MSSCGGTKSVVSLFSGIAGMERGLTMAGFQTELFCEIDPNAAVVLDSHYPGVELHKDIRELTSIPPCTLLAAGFPCQNLSQAGDKIGIEGHKSGLVFEIIRLLKSCGPSQPEWILLENVAYMLKLDRGKAMRDIISAFEELGYRWAYRTVDARAFGLPQRRNRVLFLASREHNPSSVLLRQQADVPPDPKPSEVDPIATYGFYWTEGSRGVGWTREGTPPIKGGSGLGIPSPPAVWVPAEDFIGTISIEDAERLQGFPRGWTDPMVQRLGAKTGARWKAIGNAVSVPMAKWIGEQLLHPDSYKPDEMPWDRQSLPSAAYGCSGHFSAVASGPWPVSVKTELLLGFLDRPLAPLSARATSGFLSRAVRCTNVVYSQLFLDSLGRHAQALSQS
jgi:DNA (cytosine-5)-methyltransferase 1